MGCHLTMPGSTHITVIKLHILRTETENDYAETWYWSRNQRQHQVDEETIERARFAAPEPVKKPSQC